METILIVIVLAILYLNIVASYHSLSSEYSTTFQKAAQLFIVWLLPVIGAVLVIAILLGDRQYGHTRSRGFVTDLLLLSFVFAASSSAASEGNSSDGGHGHTASGGEGD